MPVKAKLIPPDGSVSEILLPDGDAERLVALQGIVGGMFEVKALTNGMAMVVLDGSIQGDSRVNEFATSLAFRAHAIFSDEDIFGTVVVIREDLL